MVSPLLTLLLIAGASPCENCGGNGVYFSPYACPHRQLNDCPGREVYAQTSPHRKHPPRTAWMYRYTYFYGINYSRPDDFRLLYDYPWYNRGDSLPRRPLAAQPAGQGQPAEEWHPVEEFPAAGDLTGQDLYQSARAQQATFLAEEPAHPQPAARQVPISRMSSPAARNSFVR